MANAERVLNRTERLFALVLLLQNKPNLSSRDLARHFEVSRRTIFRDLRALAESGVPLTYAEGGGYEILEGYQLPPLMLSAREAATLLIGAEFVKLQPDPSLRKDADGVALKIAQVLPDEVRAYVERLRDATVLDPYWLHTSEPATDEQGRWYELSEAVARQRAVMMDYYVASRDEVTRRKVDPLGLVYYSDHWNLIAHDHLRGDIRNFRLEEIRWMRVLTETFRRPEGFDLARHLEERGAATRTQERVVLRFEPGAYRWARRGIPARIEEEREVDGRTEVTFYFENLDYVARWLLRYGTQVEVVAPERLRDRMRDEATAMLRQYEAQVA
jgi:predicted DNA-binding transcriptional regulator YafY